MKPSVTRDPWTDSAFMKGHRAKTLGLTVVFNFFIAGFLYVTDLFQGPFVPVLIISQSIGVSICLAIGCSFRLLKPGRDGMRLLVLLSAIILGTVAGLVIGVFLSGQGSAQTLSLASNLLRTLLLGLFFGGIISYFFISSHRLSHAHLEIQAERLKRETTEKQAAQTQLKLLQAQVEPHFLFNTLSNIISLLETDVNRGKTMLTDLTRYLRAALDKSRSSTSTLGQEMELIRAYIQLHQVRMGDRLRAEITMPEDLDGLEFPPMLIQPLVENAIKHGLDPLVDGGCLTITAARTENRVQIRVSDTGQGLSPTSSTRGVGLSNIQERLESLYGSGGGLILEPNDGPGLTVILEVPCEKKS
ncbi:MAG: histidine kinase [Pseudomonadota bacterium]